VHLLGLAEVAVKLGLSERRVRALVADGRIGAIKIGGAWVVTEREFNRFRALPRHPGRPAAPK
jgi:excisionase family DNA binding protein